jgi:uncharacterized protein YdhG (YjbR/CyaY superfamily)
MQSKATSPEDYLNELPEDRKAAINALRKVIKKHLPKGFKEEMSYGMIGYVVPYKLYPNGYHCDPKQPLPFAGLASQKNHMSIYVMGCYGSPEQELWFRDAWAKTGKKLDMGKACVRFKKLSDVALDVIGESIKRMPAKAYVAQYQASIAGLKSAKGAVKETVKKAAKKTAAK